MWSNNLKWIFFLGTLGWGCSASRDVVQRNVDRAAGDAEEGANAEVRERVAGDKADAPEGEGKKEKEAGGGAEHKIHTVQLDLQTSDDIDTELVLIVGDHEVPLARVGTDDFKPNWDQEGGFQFYNAELPHVEANKNQIYRFGVKVQPSFWSFCWLVSCTWQVERMRVFINRSRHPWAPYPKNAAVRPADASGTCWADNKRRTIDRTQTATIMAEYPDWDTGPEGCHSVTALQPQEGQLTDVPKENESLWRLQRAIILSSSPDAGPRIWWMEDNQRRQMLKRFNDRIAGLDYRVPPPPKELPPPPPLRDGFAKKTDELEIVIRRFDAHEPERTPPLVVDLSFYERELPSGENPVKKIHPGLAKHLTNHLQTLGYQVEKTCPAEVFCYRARAVYTHTRYEQVYSERSLMIEVYISKDESKSGELMWSLTAIEKKPTRTAFGILDAAMTALAECMAGQCAKGVAAAEVKP